MRLAASIVLVAGVAAAQPVDPCSLPGMAKTIQCRSRALFEFAPSSGAGMGTACACAAVTGAKGEALTFTRSSSGTCLKGNTTSGIANGDMVTCSSNQPRVMPGGDGTGPLGLLVEGARENKVLRSQEWDNAAWTLLGSVVAQPTVTANAGVAPDGTTTADRIQVSACAGSGASAIYQLAVCTGTASRSFFLKGVSGSGFTRLTDGSGIDTQCTYNASTWTRCVFENSAAAETFLVGNNCAGGDTMAAGDFYAWGAQCETGAFSSSYIATTSSAVTRAADVASFPLTLSGATVSFAASLFAPSTLASNVLLNAYKDGNNGLTLSVSSSKARGTFRIGGSNSTQDSSGSLTVSALNALAAYYDGTNKAGCLGGACNTAAASLTLATGSHTLYLGADQAGANQAFGVVKQVCLDPSPTRCR